MFNITPLVRTIIIINVVIFLLQQFLSSLTTVEMNGMEYRIGLSELISLWNIGHPLFKPYQFFTYMFAHGGYGHIFFNMLAFASFAPVLEGYWGDKKFLLFYIVTGMGAGVIYALTNYFMPGNAGSMLGASGAIYGILMAFGMLFPDLELMLLFPPIPIKAKYMVFIMGFITYAMDRSGTVAHVAHFGGAFVAFLLITYWRTQGK